MNWRKDLDENGSVAPQRPRVLVLDDNDVDRFAVCRALHESGIAADVHDTGSAAQALDRINTTPFDCLFIGNSFNCPKWMSGCYAQRFNRMFDVYFNH